jgi:hypothetical protein
MDIQTHLRVTTHRLETSVLKKYQVEEVEKHCTAYGRETYLR